MNIIGIRKEEKAFETRVPLIPKHIENLIKDYKIEFILEPSNQRAFSAEEYEKIGVKIKPLKDSQARVIIGIKEMPLDFFEKNKVYAFFSHTIKGQEHNMPMLKQIIDTSATLLDYEKIVDEKNRRLIFFGNWAGLAGMIEILWGFGQRVKLNNKVENPFLRIKHTWEYETLDHARKAVSDVGKEIIEKGLPKELVPLVIGFAGYGNVSRGAQEILDILPLKEITPNKIDNIQKNQSNKLIYKVVFKEEDIVEPISDDKKFNLQDYYDNPHLYRSVFHKYIDKLSILMNCIFWNKQYPRLVTKKYMEKYYNTQFKLQVIGDISVDINGAIEFTKKATTPDKPVFVYNPINDKIIDGYKSNGCVVMAVDNLPCELPKESSQAFSNILLSFVPSIVKADFSIDFNNLKLPPEIKKAVVLYHGELTSDYSYINKFL